MKKIFNNSWLHLVIALLLLSFLFIQPKIVSVNEFSHQSFEEKLNKKELTANKELENLITIKDLSLAFNKNYNQLEKKDISLFVLQNNKTLFWTSRDIDFNDKLTDFKTENGVVTLKNGWYQYLIKKQNQKTYLALILIKHHYPIENNFLKNEFNKNFHLSSNTSIHLKKVKNSFLIKNQKGAPLFYLAPSKEIIAITHTDWIIIGSFFLGLLLLISFVSKQTLKRKPLRKYAALLTLLFIVLTWVIVVYFQLPNIVFLQELFNPTIYAQSSFLPSLGHFLILSIFMLVFVYQLTKTSKYLNKKNKVLVILLIFLVATFPIIYANLLEGLVKNSTLIFDTNFITKISIYSFVGLFSILILFIAFTIFLQWILSTFSNQAFKDYQINTLLIITTLLTIIISIYFFETHLLLSLWSIGYVITTSLLKNVKNTFYKGVTITILAALTLSYGFIHFGEEKAHLKKAFLAKKLTKEKDPVAEYLFEELKLKIEADTLLKNNITNYWENKEKIDEHLQKKYFQGFWGKYNVNILLACQQLDTIFVEEISENVNCLAFFNEKVEKEADTPFDINESFNFLYSEDGSSSYLAQLKINTNHSSSKNANWNLFMELFPKGFSKTEGYPELLLNQKDIENISDYTQYAFAKYKNGSLVNNSGGFNYSLKLDQNLHFDANGFLNMHFEKYNHLLYQSDKNTIIIISSPEKTVFNYITTFSYLFLLCFILVLILGVILKVTPFNWKVAYTDFSTKIQLFIIASIFLSFILFSWGTTYYIKKQYHEKNKKNITEKVQSVLIELEHKLGGEKRLTVAQYEEMTYYLVKFSNVFYTDINLFNKNGLLLASSRPEIYDIGVLSKQMEPSAFRQLHFNNKSSFIHKEKIGGLNYLSAYVPFRNENNKILAYMNLPYFAKQNELEKELSAFFTALINVYGLLFLISAIIAVFFANYISEPLRMIKDKLGALQLGQSYEQIEWQSNDEIGSLVLEYNKKVLELEHSAQLLIKSERESAWREMAKQVAHEIKNPLTPMKLGIQQLQRVANDNPDDLAERIDRTAKTLIEQIETLTRIANEFSSFAIMPKADDQKIEVLPIIETTIDLFDKNISIHNNCSSPIQIVGDKNQISRVFNNLIKNALQAIPEDKEGKIEITLTQQDETYLIKVKDNGSGITEEQKDKIFVPNFTTKTTGMGLGLAMVKNIVEAANGKIWFETETGIGTTFFIQFPIVD